MKIQVIASGSAGNCYHVTDGKTEFLIEAGVRIRDIQEALGYQMILLDGCLISHEHGDHIKAAKQLAAKGINIYGSQGTFEAANLKGHRFRKVEAKKPFLVGTTIKVTPIDVEHDAAEPLAFIIYSTITKKTLLYVTDTQYVRYRIPEVNILLAECNYDKDTIMKNIAERRIPLVAANRVFKSHMSLDALLAMIKTVDADNLEEIWLLHMSNKNANQERIVKEVRRLTGARVEVA